MSDLEQRNLVIIAEVMNELGVKDIEELPAEIRKLRAIYDDVTSQLNTANHTLGQIAQLTAAHQQVKPAVEYLPNIRQSS